MRLPAHHHLADLIGVAVIAVVAGAAAALPAAARAEALPARPLRIELRCVADAAAAPSTASAAGVTVGTAGSTLVGPRRSSSEAAPAAATLWLLVDNAAVGELRLTQAIGEAPLRFIVGLDGLPLPGADNRRGRPPTAHAAVIGEHAPPLPVQRLRVHPRWSGGAAPVAVDLEVQHTGAGGSGGHPSAPDWRIQTTLSTPFERWTPFARVDAAGAGSTLSGRPCELQLRVRHVP